MFTGLIETLGTLGRMTRRGNYLVLQIDAGFSDEPIHIGESVCCDGACLTVTSARDSVFTVDVSQESLSRTIASGYRIGAKINLERALKAGDRFGGHMVSGHIDDIGTVEHARRIGDSIELAVVFDSRYDDFVVEKGSVAINGVSLTVNDVGGGRLTVNVIPLTAQMTNLGETKKGDKVNLEFDMIGKYIAKMTDKGENTNLTIEKLRESGW
ncbi:MAG: riboflavin synthase [Candidatus Zixiibacteriota bacterium]|nr:MAG: riboflavin synthase [candidate division Zixibacteria bacterium]